jgi:L-methionine (R)-S-oxide reductase
MFDMKQNTATPKPELYQSLQAQLQSLLEAERDLTANAANASALIYHTLPDLNWAGFYFYRHSELLLGPFQGKPACIRIAMGKGVCGTAAEKRETLVVQNVHDFPGHIACDSASNSEIVIPLIKHRRLIGVLDVDSPVVSRFDEEDRQGLEMFVKIFLNLTHVF